MIIRELVRMLMGLIAPQGIKTLKGSSILENANYRGHRILNKKRSSSIIQTAAYRKSRKIK